jgi:UPF0755 protein
MGRVLRISVIVFFLILLAVGGYIYQRFVSGPAVADGLSSYIIEIPTNSDFDMVLDSLKAKGFVEDEQVFRLFAQRMNYVRNPMRAGRFEIQSGWSMIDLIRHLRGGQQAPVKVVLTNERLPENVAAKAARFIEPDSLDIWQLLQDEAYLNSIGYTTETLMSLFIPNTYELYWNTSPQGFVERMIKEHQAFWDKEGREGKAKEKELTAAEVYTLASIVEKETLVNTERRRMAGVYLNRLKKGMLLQADPTSVFATRDFDTPRVTNYHTEFDSPYNTYMYTGLPPGPIAMASIGSIDAVLNAENHNYLYFCAKGDGSGLHNFATNLSAHNRNAAIYRNNLKRRGLR